jgi:hypothetical protein
MKIAGITHAGKKLARSAEPELNGRHRVRFHRYRIILVRRAQAEAETGVSRRGETQNQEIRGRALRSRNHSAALEAEIAARW